MKNDIRLEIIPSFRYYTPIIKKSYSRISAPDNYVERELELQVPSSNCEFIHHFPVILENGVPWEHAARFLTSRCLELNPPHPNTVVGIARDLLSFKQWQSENEIDYLRCDKVPKSPVRRFKRHLLNSDSSASVIKRKLGRLVSFYRWLIEEEGVHFDKPLWNERDLKVLTKNGHGATFAIAVKTTDVQQVSGSNGGHQGNGYDGYIKDGGLLRPYSIEDQKLLFETLDKIGNTEMTLSFLIALVTGARLQTIFTLRACHFEFEVEENSEEQLILAGYWPKHRQPSEGQKRANNARLINTKSNKPTKLHFPSWLYKKIAVYLNSYRYRKRAAKSKHYVDAPEKQYVFLSTRGNPYYVASKDPLITTYLKPPQGGSVQQFISQQLRPLLKESGFEEHFKFHNLRASFGMNLVRSNALDLGTGAGLTMTELFGLVQSRMNHSQFSTTQQYLAFDTKSKLASKVQKDYESHLNELIEGVR